MIERILAVVDGRPVLLSEVELLGHVQGVSRAAAVEHLVDERLMYREASRLPQAVVTPEEEERAYRSLLARLPEGEANAPAGELRQLARRQTAILKYIEFRFRPQVRIEEEQVRKAYEEDYAGKDGAPPYEQVAERLRERLAREDLDRRIEEWVRELRAGSEIRYNAPEPAQVPRGSLAPPGELA